MDHKVRNLLKNGIYFLEALRASILEIFHPPAILFLVDCGKWDTDDGPIKKAAPKGRSKSREDPNCYFFFPSAPNWARYAQTLSWSASEERPWKIILVPATLAFGFLTNSLKEAASQVMPEPFIASE